MYEYYNVAFFQHGPKKIETIKLVRQLTGWGLRESKDFVEGPAGEVLNEEVSYDQAMEIVGQFARLGAVFAAVLSIGSGETLQEEVIRLRSENQLLKEKIYNFVFGLNDIMNFGPQG